MDEVNESIRRIIIDLLNLDNIEIEVCGMWIWVSGMTYEHRDRLRSLGLKWANRKQKWYYAGIPARQNGQEFTMQDIRDLHGSKMIKSYAGMEALND